MMRLQVRDPVLAAVDAPGAVVVDLRDLAGRPLDALRARLIGDVLRRWRECREPGPVPLLLLDDVDGAEGLDTDPGPSLWIGDPSARVRSAAAAAALVAGAETVALVPDGRRGPADLPPGRRVRIGPVILRGSAARAVSEVLDGDLPLALRLALLRFPVVDAAELTSARLHRATETLQRWQVKVAYWAELPASPAPRPVIDDLRAASAALDTAAMLTQLHRLETDLHLAAGSKFDAFTLADRVLGLDLRHLVGKLRR